MLYPFPFSYQKSSFYDLLQTEEVGLEGAEAPEVALVTDGGIQTEDENPDHLTDKLSLIGKIVIDKQVKLNLE